jgi:hypothetical protein
VWTGLLGAGVAAQEIPVEESDSQKSFIFT